MKKKDIEAIVKRIFFDLFNRQVSENECTTYILCGENDLKARDLVYFMADIEKYFSIKFPQNSIENNDLFTLNSIVNAVERLVSDKGV